MATALARAGNTSCAGLLGPLHQFSDGDRRGAVRASGVLRLLGGCACGGEGGGAAANSRAGSGSQYGHDD